MAVKTLILPKETQNNLKCFFCGKFLSVGPIYSVTDEGDYKCGRCENISSKLSIRNFCYEEVAAYLTFQCSHPECKEKHLFGVEMEQHEKFCPHRTLQCLEFGCLDQIKVVDLLKHFENKHSKSVFYGGIKHFRGEPKGNISLLLKMEMNEYIVIISHKDNDMYAGVFSIQPIVSDVKFILSFRRAGKCNPVICFEQKVFKYSESVHCVNCMGLHCELPYHKYALDNDHGENIYKLPIQIEFNLYKEILMNPSIIEYSVIILNDNSYVKGSTESFEFISEMFSESN